MINAKKYNFGILIKICGALFLACLIIKFTLLSSKPLHSDTSNLEFVVTDFNHNPITNAEVRIYTSLNNYLNDHPISIDNWECSKNHYIFQDLVPQDYYFRITYASLDNSSDTYCTQGKLDAGKTGSYNITLK